MSKKGKQRNQGVQGVPSEQVVSAVKKEKVKAIQLQSQPPTPVKGKKAIWHQEYSYSNSKGTKITINGHWEVIDESKKKVAPAAKEEAKEEGAEGEAEE